MFRLLLLTIAIALGSGQILPSGLQVIHEGRIIGGEETTIDRFPYQLSTRYFAAHRGGASLVRSNFVLTSALCVHDINPVLLRFVAGTSFRNKGGDSLDTEEIFLHEEFDHATFRNDIAVVKLKGHFDYSDTIQPIALANTHDVFKTDTRAFVSGWGTLSEEAIHLPFQLHFTEVFAVDIEECAASYADKNQIVKGMICAGMPRGTKDPCQGDAGGPLVVGSKQIGIVSWGEGCGRGNYPKVYVDVAFYRTWIETKLLS